jgi:hypothetical protein
LAKRYSRIRDLVHCTSHFGAALALSRAVLITLGLDRLQASLERAAGRYSDRRALAFDARYGTETFERIALSEMGLGGKDEALRRWRYGPINPDFFHEMMLAGPRHRHEITFIDVGSGKGLALMLASGYGFRRVVGIDMSGELNEIARRNMAAYLHNGGKGGPVDLVCADFLQFELPREPTFYFLNNPFPEHVGDRALTHLERSLQAHPRDAWILWRRCTSAIIDRLDQSPLWSMRVATPYWRLYQARPHQPANGSR